MALISLRQLLDQCAEPSYGVPQFNVNNLEQIQAIMEAAQRDSKSGDIASLRGPPASKRGPYLRHMVLAAVELTQTFPWSYIRTTGQAQPCARSPFVLDLPVS